MDYSFQGGSADTWTAYNRVLPRGVIGVETNTGKYKVGNNEDRWKDLEYSGGDVYPQFRVENEQLQEKTSEEGEWADLYTALGHPGTRGSYNPGSGEGRFFYDLLEGEDIGPAPDFPDGPAPETSDTRLNTVAIPPGTGNADVDIGTTVVGVEVVNEDDDTNATVIVEGQVFVLKPGRSITAMNYAGFSTFEIDATGDWSAVGFKEIE